MNIFKRIKVWYIKYTDDYINECCKQKKHVPEFSLRSFLATFRSLPVSSPSPASSLLRQNKPSDTNVYNKKYLTKEEHENRIEKIMYHKFI